MIDYTKKLDIAMQPIKRSRHSNSRINAVITVVPPGLAAYKLVPPRAIAKTILPKYVMVERYDADEVEFSGAYSQAGFVLVKMAFPGPAERQKQDLEVVEWGDRTIYYAGNPAILAEQRQLTPGQEALILVPVTVLGVYYPDGGEFSETYTSRGGETITVMQ